MKTKSSVSHEEVKYDDNFSGFFFLWDVFGRGYGNFNKILTVGSAVRQMKEGGGRPCEAI